MGGDLGGVIITKNVLNGVGGSVKELSTIHPGFATPPPSRGLQVPGRWARGREGKQYEHPGPWRHACVPREERLRSGLSDGLIRLSVGIEDAEDLPQPSAWDDQQKCKKKSYVL